MPDLAAEALGKMSTAQRDPAAEALRRLQSGDVSQAFPATKPVETLQTVPDKPQETPSLSNDSTWFEEDDPTHSVGVFESPGHKTKRLEEDAKRNAKVDDFKAREFPAMPLQEKIKTRKEFTDTYAKYYNQMRHVFGQEPDEQVTTLQAKTLVDQDLPLDEQSKGIEKNYWAGIKQTQKDTSSLKVGTEGNFATERGKDVAHGVLNAVPGLASATGETMERFDRQINRGLGYLTNGKAPQVSVAAPGVESVLNKAGKTGTEYIDLAMPPTEGAIRGDTSAQVADTLGNMLALHGLGSLAKSVAGVKDAELLSKLMMTAYGSDMAGKTIQQAALEKNLSEGMLLKDALKDAQNKGDYGAMIMAPIAGYTSKFSPITKLAGNKMIAPTLGEKVLVGGLGSAAQFGSQRVAINALEYVPHVFDIKNFHDNGIVGLFDDLGTDALVGAVSGGVIGAISPGMSAEAKAAMHEHMGREIDISGQREAQRVFQLELRQSGDIARAQAKILDSVVDRYASELQLTDPNASKSSVYLSIIANRLQRDNPSMIKFAQPEQSAGLYSALREKVLDPKFAQAFPKEADPNQILSYLKNQPGIKPDELRWTETEDFLREQAQQGKKVSGQSLLDHLQENEVKIQTLVKSKQADMTTTEEIEKLQDQFMKLNAQLYEQRGTPEKNVELQTWHDQILRQLHDIELQNRQVQPSYQTITPSGPAEKYEEWLLKLPVNENKPIGESYSPPHFGPEARNTLVHIRLDERVINGKKTMMIHEVQSDWHQTGKEYAYHSEVLTDPTKRSEAYARLSVLTENKIKLREQGVTDGSEYNKLEKETHKLQGLLGDEHNVPDGPMQKSWNELAWKKILLEASSRGYEQVAWAPGELQDKFQGDPGEEAREGRKTFYNKITPQVITKLLKGRGWEGPVGTGELDTGLSTQKEFHVVREPDHDVWHIVENGEVAAGPFITELEAHAHQVALENKENSGETEPVFTIDLPQHIRDRINVSGFPLFQPKAGSQHLEQVLTSARPMKMIMMKDGTIFVGPHPSHLDIIKDKGINPDEIASTGLAVKAGDQILYRGTDSLIDYYKAELSGKTTSAEPKEENVTSQVLTGKSATYVEQGKMLPSSAMNFFRNQEMFQGNRASVEFLDTMQAIVRGLNPDASSGVHEALGHIVRQHLLPTEYLETLEQHFGVKDGQWTREQEEAFATTMESYVGSNRPPSGDLQGAFQLLSDAMKVVYKNAEFSPLDIPISEETRKYFDAMFQKERGGVEVLRESVVKLDKQIEEMRSSLDAYDTSTPEGLMDRAQQLKDIKEVEAHQTKAVAELQQEQKLVLNPRERTRQEKLYEDAQAVPIPPRESPENYWSVTQNASQFTHWASEALSHMTLVNDTKTGRSFIQLADDLYVRVRRTVGKFQPSMEQVFNSLSKADAQKLNEFTDGQRNFRQMYDEVTATKPMQANTPGEKMVVGLQARVLAQFDQSMEAINTLRKMNSGDTVPAIAGFTRRLPYMLNSTGMSAIKAGPGNPVFEKYVDWVSAHNPNVKREVFIKDVKANMDSIVSRPFGMMEFTRNIRYLPDALDVGGQRVEVTHSNLYDLIHRIIDRTALRQAIISVGGQKMMENAADVQGPGYKGRLIKLARIFDEPLYASKENLQSQLVELGNISQTDAEKMSLKDLRKYVGGLQGRVQVDAYELLGKFLDKTSDDIVSVSAQRRLRGIATEIGGIDSKAPISDVWNEIKRRLASDVEDDVFKYWKLAHTNEGGDGANFDKFLRIMQGIPEQTLDFSKVHTRIFESIANTAGSLVTSGTVIKHASRPMRSVSVVGPVNAVKALNAVLTDYPSERQNAILYGAARVANHWYGPETTSGLSRMSDAVRFGVQKGTLSDSVTQWGNVFDATAGRFLAQDWIKNGFGRTDVDTAKALRLNDAEIKTLLDTNGKGMDDGITSKIIQNVGNVTQGTMENPFRRGAVETSPFLKRIFAFNNFKAMAVRNSLTVAEVVKDSIQSGDPVRMLGAGKLFARYIAAMIGSGFVTQALYGKFKGKPQRYDEEDTYKSLASALFASHMFGVSEQVLDKQGFGHGLGPWMLNNAPIISSVAGALGTLMGVEGKTADLLLNERAKATAQQYIPVVGAGVNWWERSNNLPRVQAQEVRNQVSAWKRTQPDYKEGPSVSTPLNPDYYPIWDAVSRYDLEDATKLMQDYITKEQGRGVQPRKAALNLRTSLVERAPLNLSHKEMGRFLYSIPEKDRAKALMLHRQYMGIVNSVIPIKPN